MFVHNAYDETWITPPVPCTLPTMFDEVSMEKSKRSATNHSLPLDRAYSNGRPTSSHTRLPGLRMDSGTSKDVFSLSLRPEIFSFFLENYVWKIASQCSQYKVSLEYEYSPSWWPSISHRNFL